MSATWAATKTLGRSDLLRLAFRCLEGCLVSGDLSLAGFLWSGGRLGPNVPGGRRACNLSLFPLGSHRRTESFSVLRCQAFLRD
jgi:hypothetical protein